MARKLRWEVKVERQIKQADREARAVKREANRIDKLVEQAYYASCSGIQINVMDIGKVFVVGRKAYAEGARGELLEAAVREFVEVIRKN